MSGLKQQSSAATWISLSEGKFSVKENGVVNSYPCFEGTLVGIGFVDKEYDKKPYRQLTMTFFEGGRLFKIGMSSSSGYGKQTILKLLNCDIHHPIEFSPTYESVGSKKNSGMFLSQFGSPIRQKYTKDNPGDCPPAESTQFDGKTLWSFKKQSEWLEQAIMDHCSAIAAANLVRPQSHQPSGLSSGDEAGGEESQDNMEDGSGIPADNGDTPF